MFIRWVIQVEAEVTHGVVALEVSVEADTGLSV